MADTNVNAAMLIAGLVSEEESELKAPNNVHVMSGTVVEDSADGLVRVAIDSDIYGDEDSGYITVSTLGGLSKGDEATILLFGENGLGMAPLALGANGSIDRIRDEIPDSEGDISHIGYRLRTNNSSLPASDTGYRYRLWFTSADGKSWVPATTSTSMDSSSIRSTNQRPIDPFGPIVYYGRNATTEAGSVLTASDLWQQYIVDLGYSFNTSGSELSLTCDVPVYLKCEPRYYDWATSSNRNGAIMLGITQALPTYEDGYIYVLLGFAYSSSGAASSPYIELRTEHPVYYYDGLDGGIQHWDGDQAISANEIDAILAT